MAKLEGEGKVRMKILRRHEKSKLYLRGVTGFWVQRFLAVEFRVVGEDALGPGWVVDTVEYTRVERSRALDCRGCRAVGKDAIPVEREERMSTNILSTGPGIQA